MRGFLATPKYFLDKSPRGIKYIEKYKSSKSNFHVAVSAAIADELPSLPQLLRAISQVPGSCFHFYVSAQKLCKFCQKAVKTTPRILKRVYALATQAARHNVEQEYRGLYMSPQSFLLKFNATERAVCPRWYGSTRSGGRPVGGIS